MKWVIKHLYSVCIFMAVFLIPCASLANFTQLDRVTFHNERGTMTANWDDSFKDYGTKINISLIKGNSGRRVFTVKQKGKVVYQYPVAVADNGYVMQRVRDDASGRIFYILHTGEIGGYVFGYDPENGVWNKYIDVKNYYAGLNYDFSGINLKNGDMDLYFSQSTSPYAHHDYRLFWNNTANWFGYEDLGISYR